jgi:signal transduction histidine kinase
MERTKLDSPQKIGLKPMKRISYQIMIAIIALSLATSVLIGGITYLRSVNYIRDGAKRELDYMARSHAATFSQRFIEVETSVGILHTCVSSMFDAESFAADPGYFRRYEKDVDAILADTARNHRGFSGVYFTFNPELTGETREIWYLDVNLTGDPQRVSNDLYTQVTGEAAVGDSAYPSITAFYPANPAMEYYYLPIGKETGVWYEPYQEPGFSITNFGYSQAVYGGDTLVGVIGVDFDVRDIIRTVSRMEVLNRGYAFLLTPDRRVIAHPTMEDCQSIVETEDPRYRLLLDGLASMADTGIIEGRSGRERIVFGYGVLSSGWVLVLAPEWREIFKPLKELALTLMSVTFLIMLVSALAAYAFSNRIAIPVKAAAEQLRFLELGDFTHQIPEELLTREDELGVFIKSVHTMKSVIKALMKELEFSSAPMEPMMALVNRMADETLRASEDAASAIQGMAAESLTTEEKLRKMTYWLLKAQHIGNIGTWEYDTVSGSLYWSPEMFRIMNRPAEDAAMTLDIFRERVHPEDRESVRARFGEAESGGPYTLEYRVTDFHGRTIWLHEAGEFIHGHNGKPVCAYGICQDITERKAIIERLETLNSDLSRIVAEEVEKNRQKDAALTYQSRLAKMGEMIAHIAHQWRQPLNNLSLILSNLRGAIASGETDSGELVDSIRRSEEIIQRMSRTIDDFRHFLKPREERELFSVESSVRFIVDMIKDSLKLNKIQVEILPRRDSLIYGFSNEFSQVLSNILYNARDALMENDPEGRRIEIRITGETSRAGAMARVEIFNNGPPIQPETMARLFQPYFSTKTKGEGTGIGLYMSRLIIERHFEGTIMMENQEGGVRCLIDIPAARGNGEDGT